MIKALSVAIVLSLAAFGACAQTATPAAPAADGAIMARPACSASGGAPAQPLIILVAGNEDPPVVAGLTVSGINRYAVDNGASWTAHLQKASDGSALPGSMIAQLYCWYP